jgi:hypothetical protein
MADDFEALRTIRTGDAELDADRAARMRARALATVLGGADRDEGDQDGSLLTERAARRPQPGTADGDATPRTLEVVTPFDGDGVRRADPRSSRPGAGSGRRPFVVAVAAAAAILAVVVGIGVSRQSPTGVVADQPARTSVTDLADRARLAVDRPLGPDEHAHLVVESGELTADGTGEPARQVRTRETWATSSGTGREKMSALELVDDRGEVVAVLDDAQDDSYTDGSPGFGVFGYDDLRALPTDPGELHAALRAGTWGTPDDDATEARFIGQLLMLDATPPAVRAAALRLLADRGATVVEDAVDHDGNRGVGIEWRLPDGTTVVYVLGDAGLLSGSYTLAPGAPADPAEAVSWTSVEARDRTATAG